MKIIRYRLAFCFLSLGISASIFAGEPNKPSTTFRSQSELSQESSPTTEQDSIGHGSDHNSDHNLDKNTGQSLNQKALMLVDGVHESLSDQLISASNYIDNFFSDERMEDEGSKSKVVFSYLAGYDDFRGGSNLYSLRAQLHFPKTQRRLRLVIDGDGEETSESESGASDQTETVSRIEELKAALQYIFVTTKFWQISANTGIRFSVPLDPFAKLRVRRLFFVDSLTLRLTQSVFYFKTDGWGETTSFDVERKLNETYFFRSSSKITAIRDTGERSFSQAWSIFQDVGKKKIMVYTLGGNADLNKPVTSTLYYVNTRFRHNFYKKWAFYELVPVISLERANSFNVSPGFFVKLDIVFGR